MKRYHQNDIAMVQALSIALLLILMCGMPHHVFSQSPKKLGYNIDLVPSFYWKEKTNKKEGIDAEIISTLFNRCNYSVDIAFYPWKRLINSLKNGEIDIGGPGFKTPSREQFAIYLDTPLNYATFSIFVRKGESFSYNQISDLYGKTIGINRGYSISPKINELQHKGKITIMPANTAEINLNKLVYKRIDAYVGNRDAVLFKAMRMKISDKIEYLPTPINPPRPVYLMISKNASLPDKDEMIKNLNHHLKMMWIDKTIDRIIDKYIMFKSYKGK
jgi:polar amino acid transport system substrate-binding protein